MSSVKYVIATGLAATLLAGSQVAVAAPAATSKYAVSASVSGGSHTVGDYVTFKVVSKPSYSNQPAYIQQYYSRKWHSIAKKTLIKGVASVRVRLTGAGTVAYRAAVTSHKKRAAGASKTLSLTVYRWHYLSNLNPAQDEWRTGPVEINGTKYVHSVFEEGQDEGSVGYNLSRKCTAVRAVAGMSDDSQAGDQYDFSISVDGVTAFERTLGLDQDAPVSLNVSGALRLQLDATQVSDSAYAFDDISYGNIRVLCRF